MTKKPSPQRRYHILDQDSELVRILHAPGMEECAAIEIAQGILHAPGLRPRDSARVVDAVHVVEFGCDPETGADGPNFNLGPAPGGGYIVSRLVYSSDGERHPVDELCAAVRTAIRVYDGTKDHDPSHNGLLDHDCIRCALVKALPPTQRGTLR